jgi:hypothetical protein
MGGNGNDQTITSHFDQRDGRRVCRRSFGSARHRARPDAGPHRLSPYAGGRRTDVAGRPPGILGRAGPGPGVHPVHDGARTVPGDDRRLHRHAQYRSGHLELPRPRPGQEVPDQLRRVRHRPALGQSRDGGFQLRGSARQADLDDTRDDGPRLPGYGPARQRRDAR